ncbi:hypothetical protein [Methylocystis sp.]|uniref:hypothetical protein n=1 Tax=Methylocystis sp. TaxID=1911079 RepID=UPI003D0AC66E
MKVYHCIKALLTYMSIRDEINRQMGAELFLLRPEIKSSQFARTIFVSRDVMSALQPESWKEEERHRMAMLRGDLDRFITGEHIAVMLDPKDKPTTYLKRLKPVASEVWEIRSCDPKPQIRVLGRFSEQDVFIALNWEFRSQLWGSEWDAACNHCLSEWQRILPMCSAHRGRSVSDYVSERYVSV